MFPFVRARCAPARFHRGGALGILVAIAVALLSPRAFAVAPMCDPSGASVPAPIPAPPYATGDLTAPRNCDDTPWSGVDVARPGHSEVPPKVRAWNLPDHVLPTPFEWAPLRGTVLPRADAVLPPHRPGFSEPVYRPPRG
jgi:hypothetical protein